MNGSRSSGRLLIGVDLGLSGGLAVLDSERKICEIVALKARDDPRRSNVHSEILRIRRKYPEAEIFGAVEQPPAVKPGGQTNAAAITGLWCEYGLTIAAFELIGIEFAFFAPVSWQSRFWKHKERVAQDKTTKQMARAAVERLWPGFNWKTSSAWNAKDCEGAVDATLVAFFAMVHIFGDKFERADDGADYVREQDREAVRSGEDDDDPANGEAGDPRGGVRRSGDLDGEAVSIEDESLRDGANPFD